MSWDFLGSFTEVVGLEGMRPREMFLSRQNEDLRLI